MKLLFLRHLCWKPAHSVIVKAYWSDGREEQVFPLRKIRIIKNNLLSYISLKISFMFALIPGLTLHCSRF